MGLNFIIYEKTEPIKLDGKNPEIRILNTSQNTNRS